MVRIICGYLFVVSAKLAITNRKVNNLYVKTAPSAGTKTNKDSLAAPSA